jgi:hypothetical protein
MYHFFIKIKDRIKRMTTLVIDQDAQNAVLVYIQQHTENKVLMLITNPVSIPRPVMDQETA